jgi:hypothetical protein
MVTVAPSTRSWTSTIWTSRPCVLALVVRGADTDHRDLTPESPGLYALATGFQAISKDDVENMARQFPAYDALYAFCRSNH